MQLRTVLYQCLFLLGLLSSAAPLSAQGIDFESGYMKEVKAKAQAAGKPIFVDVFTTWCVPCHYMDEFVFTDSTAASFFNKHLVSVQLDAEAGEGIEFAQRHGINAFPTLLILNAEGEELGRHMGALDAQQLKIWAATVLSKDMPHEKRPPKRSGK